MNNSQLRRLGVPEFCLKPLTTAIRQGIETGRLERSSVKTRVRKLVADPGGHQDDPVFGSVAYEMQQVVMPSCEPVEYQTWGTEIDEQSHRQMREACRLPSARQAALMPDAHVGYGLPIGGVLGLENAVVPYAVGVDIACRMKLSVLDSPVGDLKANVQLYRSVLERGTIFGVGERNPHRPWHSVLDRDWSITRITRKNRDKAAQQLGTSGSGNHFVEFGILTLPGPELDLEAGQYVALLSHSGSRGPGASVCQTYSSIAQQRLTPKHRHFGRLAWLDMDSQEGQEYWQAMQLMGDFAAANHEVIHRRVVDLLGAEILGGVENHHNFAWQERHGDRDLIVHRKGATPASLGEPGVIPGSMATPTFVVRGKGNPVSLNSASHGAGRKMSRRQARATYRFQHVRRELESQGIHVLGAGSDEVPAVYKDIETVMRQQQDLVSIMGRFDPQIVRMCDDGSRPED